MRAWLAVILLALPIVAIADPTGIRLENAWSRAMPAGATGVVYLTIIDQGTADTLTGVASPVAARASLHRSFDEKGVMRMRPVESLPVSPGNPIRLSPGGYHIMLEGLKQSLAAGTSFPVTLTFAKAGPVTTTVAVEKPGHVPAAGGSHMDKMDMHDMPMGHPSGK